MILIDKNDLPEVAMEFMNDVHNEDVDIINDLYALVLRYEDEPNKANEKLLNEKYEEWFSHTIEHFKNEEEKMLELNFPPYQIHKSEHENALYMMDKVYRFWQDSKEIAILRQYLSQELPPWLLQHIQTMDTVTAMFFKTGMSPCPAH